MQRTNVRLRQRLEVEARVGLQLASSSHEQRRREKLLGGQQASEYLTQVVTQELSERLGSGESRRVNSINSA